MAVGVFGVPSVSTTLCIHLIKAVLCQSFGKWRTTSVSTLTGIETSSCDIGTQHSIIFSHAPEPELIEFLTQKRTPIIVFLRSFEANVRELVEREGIPPIKAIRDTSLSMASLEEVIFAPNVFVIRGNEEKLDIKRVLGRLADFFGLNRARLDINQIIGDLALRPRPTKTCTSTISSS